MKHNQFKEMKGEGGDGGCLLNYQGWAGEWGENSGQWEQERGGEAR